MNARKQQRAGGFAQQIHHKKTVMTILIERYNNFRNSITIPILISINLKNAKKILFYIIFNRLPWLQMDPSSKQTSFLTEEYCTKQLADNLRVEQPQVIFVTLYNVHIGLSKTDCWIKSDYVFHKTGETWRI